MWAAAMATRRRTFGSSRNLSDSTVCGSARRSLIFLQRQQTACFRLRRLSATESPERLEKYLMAEAPERVIKRSEVISRLVEVQCRLLEYGRNPQAIARD